MSKYTYAEIANNFELWGEYVDPNAVYSATQFNTMTQAEKIQLQVDSFGTEIECAECAVIFTKESFDQHECD